MPPPISSQSDRSWLDAPANLGNHTKGAETTRPSDSVTDSASREHNTSTANVSPVATVPNLPLPTAVKTTGRQPPTTSHGGAQPRATINAWPQ